MSAIPGPPAASEQILARLFVEGLHIVVKRLPGLLCQFKLDRVPGFLLAHRGAIDGVTSGRNVLDADTDHVAAAQLAVNGEIE